MKERRDLTWVRSKVEETLNEERKNLEICTEKDDLIGLAGWIEALEYVLWLIDPEEEEE